MRSLLGVSPVLLLSFGSLFVLMAGLWIRSAPFLFWSSLLSLLGAAGLFFGIRGYESQDLFSGMLSHDPFGVFFGVFVVMAAALALTMSRRSREIHHSRRSEFYSILLALTTGLVFMGTSNHFLMIYLSVETVSILSYCLAGFHRENYRSVEASLKYVVYGSLASAIMIFGMSWVFGITGQYTLTGLREYFSVNDPGTMPAMLWLGVLLVFAGLAYKVSAAPMHMWTPDVYEGAPTPVSALLSVGPKAAGLALLIRFFVVSLSVPVDSALPLGNPSDATQLGYLVSPSFFWPQLIMISSVFTMLLGNLAALGQSSVKRILAYSSIAHAGFMLMGLSTQTGAGLAAVLFYCVVYCFMNIGAFWVASRVSDTLGGDDLLHFRGLVYRRPFYAVCMAIFLFSLTGLPPLAGFIGKYLLFAATLGREMYGLALIAALNSVVALYYYVKIAKAMILESPQMPFPEQPTVFESWASRIFVGGLAVLTVVLGIYWEPVMKIVWEMLSVFMG